MGTGARPWRGGLVRVETGKTVLVVDDEENLRDFTAALIRKRGHRTLTASDGNQALGLLGSGEAVDLLVLDVVMPGPSGLETLAEIRKLGYDLPVVLLTGRSRDEDLIGGYQHGADYYITKPLKAPALLNIVDYLIGDLSPEERAELEKRL
jgi:DNA-binding response OmpR family regulator